MKIRLVAWLLILCFVLGGIPVSAEEPLQLSENISDSTEFVGNGYATFGFLFDHDLLTSVPSEGNASVTLLNEKGIGYLYLIFDKAYPSYIIENIRTGQQVPIETGFLHQCIDMSEIFEGPVDAVCIRFPRGKVSLNELMIYSPGQLPKEVQHWKTPAEGSTDLLLLSAHADDDQLFYAGLLPLYAGEKGAQVQVVYLTDHQNLTSERVHEALNGLWATGCTHYPVFAPYPDFRIDDLEDTYQEYDRRGILREELVEFVVEQLRRFRPQVVVGHDINGEYGHGMHMAYTDCLIEALDQSNNEALYPELAKKYGIWEVPKTYLHLYEENPIVLDYDSPLSHFNNLTAFQVSQQFGYPCHVSQQGTWFTDWLYGKSNEITKADEIKTYNPCQFGLYRSTVGADVNKNDFLENITTYQEQAYQEQLRQEEEAARQEALEQERLEAEKAELYRQEQERREQAKLEQERLEQEQLQQEQQRTQQNLKEKQHSFVIATVIIVPLVLIALIMIIRKIRSYASRRDNI